MFTSIVVGSDGSENASEAMSVAAQLAKQEKAKLVIAHVDERLVGKGANVSAKADEGEIRASLEQYAEQLKADGLDAALSSKETMLGGPAHVLAEIADEAGADLIVVGNRGHSAVAGVLLGSVTQRLLHLAKAPVLVVPQKS